jgi:hypothetical protein
MIPHGALFYLCLMGSCECNESATEHKEIALGAFLYTEGASHRTSFNISTQAAERHGIGPVICRWICSMLEGRNIIPTLFG